MARKTSVGGQAVIEGVMMRGSRGTATAVRLEDGTIDVDIKEFTSYVKRHKILSLPIIRGFVSLLESMIIGIKTLNYSASFFEEEEKEKSKFDSWFENLFKEKSTDVILGISLVISLAISIGLFFVFPTFLANFLYRFGANMFLVNIIEGIIRVGILLLYMCIIGKMEDINRLYQYHGAEHKTIFCYENECELTPENAAKFQRFHPRCGTNFLFIVMIVSIVIFSLAQFNTLWQKILYRILILPIVSGVSYEIIRWMGKSKGKLSNIFAYPGLKLQNLTTREPDLSQLQVAIVALEASEGLDYKESLKKYGPKITIGELLNSGVEILKAENIESYVLDTQLILAKVLNRDRIAVITNRDELVDIEVKEKFDELIQQRKEKMPIKYIIGETEFMGINLKVEEGVLIPRPDTEVLVEKAHEVIKEKGYKSICDMCSGSGAIGIALASMIEDIKVSCIDISEKAEKITKFNIEKNNLKDRVEFVKSDLFQASLSNEIKYDSIISNPPYIKDSDIEDLMEDVRNYEPRLALSGGEDGLFFYRKITEQSIKCLVPGGMLAFEIGYDQREEVSGILKNFGFSDIEVLKDLAGNDRVVVGFL